MFTEHAHLRIDPARAEEFEAAFAEAALLFQGAQGLGRLTLEREVENPESYRLNIDWARIEDHMEIFRNTEAFARWREKVGPFFVAPPEMIHARTVFELQSDDLRRSTD